MTTDLGTPTPRRVVSDGVVDTSYLGYPLHVTDTGVTVLDADLRPLGQVSSVKKARLFVRGYRREARNG